MSSRPAPIEGSCSGPYCDNFDATSGNSCTANYGENVPCCGQTDPRSTPDIRTCPSNKPRCQNYTHGVRMGHCVDPRDTVSGRCSGPYCDGFDARSGRLCTANYGENVPCCGQTDPNDSPDIRTFPRNKPRCQNYTHGVRHGSCVSSAAPSTDPNDDTPSAALQPNPNDDTPSAAGASSSDLPSDESDDGMPTLHIVLIVACAFVFLLVCVIVYKKKYSGSDGGTSTNAVIDG